MRNMNRLLLATAIAFSGLTIGCREEVAHTERDRPNLTGGRTHEESTTYRNTDGSYTTEKDKVRTP